MRYLDTIDTGALDLVFGSIVLLILVGVIIHQTINFNRSTARLSRQNDDLMNRLMSRDFSEYAAGSRALPSNYRNIKEYGAGVQGPGKDDDTPADDGLGMPVT